MAGVGESTRDCLSCKSRTYHIVALFLASPASAFVTGAHILLDGGGFISGKVEGRL